MNEPLTDTAHLKDIYSEARNKYKPRDIRVLLVAEAPPCALDRFFYFEDVKKQDSLFLEIMAILYPEMKQRYLAKGRETVRKQEMLAQFQADGYYLIDLCGIPTSIIDGPTGGDVQHLLDSLKGLIGKEVPVILIKSNVYDACYEALRSAGYNVVDERMPFPGSGQQGVFREKFKKALQEA